MFVFVVTPNSTIIYWESHFTFIYKMHLSLRLNKAMVCINPFLV